MKIKFQIVLYALLFIQIVGCAQDKNPVNTENSYEVVVGDLSIPWGFTFLPDDSMLITEKTGELIHFKNNKKVNIEGLPEIYVRGQGGLMDVVLHPNYKENGWIYISYSSSDENGSGGNTTIIRAKLKNNQLVKKEVLYKANPNSTRGQHFGSRIVFDRDVNPQDITRDCGKVYRLNDDGTIPNDNPFVDVVNAKKAIFSYGHRNP
ncbi:MAG: PQQ-dependent sugar dehydrogenase, partial [Winogradskyella sp.]|nr:PQQ-dependent sugar dehydrogenase [Winogradskyella sp.]